MNRIVKLTSIVMLVVLFTVGLSGCFGNFALTRKVYEFNKSFKDQWMNQIVFLVLAGAQVYSVVGVADVFVFNTVEFWTGTNPIAMAPGEEVIKYASQDGKDFKITIRQNRVIVEDTQNPGLEMEISYKPLEKSWYYMSAEGPVKILELSGDSATFFRPNGKTLTLSAAM